ncbi:hypothetical protein M3J09_003217 [Ascochyta lentis]
MMVVRGVRNRPQECKYERVGALVEWLFFTSAPVARTVFNPFSVVGISAAVFDVTGCRT